MEYMRSLSSVKQAVKAAEPTGFKVWLEPRDLLLGPTQARKTVIVVECLTYSATGSCAVNGLMFESKLATPDLSDISSTDGQGLTLHDSHELEI